MEQPIYNDGTYRIYANRIEGPRRKLMGGVDKHMVEAVFLQNLASVQLGGKSVLAYTKQMTCVRYDFKRKEQAAEFFGVLNRMV